MVSSACCALSVFHICFALLVPVVHPLTLLCRLGWVARVSGQGVDPLGFGASALRVVACAGLGQAHWEGRTVGARSDGVLAEVLVSAGCGDLVGGGLLLCLLQDLATSCLHGCVLVGIAGPGEGRLSL